MGLHPFTSQGGGDLEDFQKTEDWDLGPGTRPGPLLSSAKKVYLRAFLKEMRKISDMITSPNWRLKKAQDEDEPRVNRRGLQSEGFDLGPQVPVAANDQVLDPMAADHQENPLSSELVLRPSQTLIRSPFGVFRLRPQDPYWVDLMHQMAKEGGGWDRTTFRQVFSHRRLVGY